MTSAKDRNTCCAVVGSELCAINDKFNGHHPLGPMWGDGFGNVSSRGGSLAAFKQGYPIPTSKVSIATTASSTTEKGVDTITLATPVTVVAGDHIAGE